jgi:hypothetical protein
MGQTLFGAKATLAVLNQETITVEENSMSFTSIEIVEEPIAVDDYVRLVEDVGWKRFVDPASVETALRHSL